MTALLEELAGIVGDAHVLHEGDLSAWELDWRKRSRGKALAVVRPATTEQVAAVVRACAAAGTPIVPQGGNTGLVVGGTPDESGTQVVMSLQRMHAVRAIDIANLTLTVEAGCVLQSVQEAAREAGFLFPLSLAAEGSCTIGGNLATNAGGTQVLRYGNARDLCLGLEVVTAQGDIWNGLSGLRKDNTGYDLRDLFIGSEGTLGIITAATLKLYPQPAATLTAWAAVPSMEAAAETISAIIAARIIPCTLEFLDRMTVRCVEDFAKIGLPTDVEARVLMETDGHPAGVEDEAAKMIALAKQHGAREVKMAADEAEGARLASARRSAFSALARMKPTTILEDVTVPRSELARMVAHINAVAKKHNLLIGTFGHMGDGNLHPTFLTNERDTEEMHRVEQALEEIVDETLRLGGTITGEHGVGLAKKAFLKRQMGDGSYELMRTIKRALDPQALLNPGKVFD